jgi:acetyl esterase/lipase
MYLHGGGYSFYPKAFYDTVAASFALSTNANVFALDYRLAPEHRYPAQLEDAIAAYKWLIRQTADPGRLVVIGDSAGGNLALALLLSLRESRLPLPALAICLSPATDFRIDTEGAPMNSEFDWIAEDMAMQWSDWFCSPAQRSDPLVSPVLADLKGLPPIYIQAGGAEMLLPRIEEFARRAKQQGADVTLETWPEMNHVFQAFGNDVPQSREALRRIVEVITVRMAHSLTHSAVP